MRPLVIAIDGPAGSGKSTAARALAAALGYTYVDTGAMYRAIGLAANERGIDPADVEALASLVETVALELRPAPDGPRVLLDGRDVTAAIRTPAAGASASRVAVVPAVRTRLVELQRALGSGGGVVMDGRDVGTVVFPDADCKFFLTARATERARRRHIDDAHTGSTDDLASTQAEIDERDRRDRERTHSPLVPATDAIVIDTTALAPETVVSRMLEALHARARP